jgi:hypothetical protein
MAKRKVKINQGGLGDDVAKVLEVTGIKKLVEIFVDGKDCGCDKRKEQLNDLLPKRYTARCLTETEYNEWKEFKQVRTLKIEWDQVLWLCKLYSDVFKKPYWKPDCINCGGTMQSIIKMIEMIDKVFDTYEN